MPLATGVLLWPALFNECVIRGRRFAPARFCAPLAGYTHSAFRRLVSELGGCGAMWTEMLAAPQILSESFQTSPWVRRRPDEAPTVYQLMVRQGDALEPILRRLADAGADAVDLNLACHARAIRSKAAGSALFEDIAALRGVLHQVRNLWPHLLTAKIRFGHQRPDWETRFVERLRLLEDAGVDAVILHTRFFEEKFKRRARHELFPWAASLTRLPLIANGDICGAHTLRAHPEPFKAACGVMLGRMAVARPWVFASWDQPVLLDLPDIWRRLCRYVVEDFPPIVALRRLQMYANYFAANFQFGHQFKVELGRARTLEELEASSESFFCRGPAIVNQPTIAGL